MKLPLIRFLLYSIAQVLATVNDVTNGTLCGTSLDSPKEYYLSGDDIIISCTAMNSSDLLFRHNKGPFLPPSSTVNGTTVELLVKNAQTEDNGTYQCYHSNCTLSVHSWKTIHVGDLPQQPVNFECISFNFFNMTCSWTSHDNTALWKLEYITEKQLEWKCCPSYSQQNGSCDFFASPLCDFPTYPDFIQCENYQMNLTGKNKFGNKTWIYTVNTSPEIVKLNPVEIQYTKAFHRNELCVSWKASNSDFDNQTCLVSWKSQWATFWETKLLNFTSDIVKMSTIISGLRSNTYYMVNISCRWFSSNHWSNAIAISKKTLPTEPDRAPDIINGSFTEVANCRENITICLYVYWKPLPIWEWNAPNLSYDIKLHDRNYNVLETIASGNQSSAEFLLKDYIRKPYNISLSSFNDNGYSRNMSAIEVHEANISLDKVIVERDISNQGRKYFVTWIANSSQIQAISRVTYFWARGCYMYPNICPPAHVKDIQWEDVDTHNDSKWINLNNPENDEWQFGVSIETSNSVHSGIFWSDCIFPYDGHYDVVPQMTVKTSDDNDTIAEISLVFSFCNSKMRPLVYQVFYRKSMPSENDADTKIEVRNFTATHRLNNLLLDGLEANTEYNISLTIVGRFFSSPQSKVYQLKTGVMMTRLPMVLVTEPSWSRTLAQFFRLKTADPKLDTKYAIITGVTVPIIILGFLLLIYMHRRCKEKCRGPPIDVPRTEWLKVPDIIKASDIEVTSREIEDNNADNTLKVPRAMTSEQNKEERGLNTGQTSGDGQFGYVVVGSIDESLCSSSTINEDEFRSYQKPELLPIRENGELSSSVTNLNEVHFACSDFQDGNGVSPDHISIDVEPWKPTNLNSNKEHEVHSYVSAGNFVSEELMDFSAGDRSTTLVKDQMSECPESKLDVKTKYYIHNYDYKEDDEDSGTQICRDSKENFEMKDSVSNDHEEVNDIYLSNLNNDTEPYVKVT